MSNHLSSLRGICRGQLQYEVDGKVIVELILFIHFHHFYICFIEHFGAEDLIDIFVGDHPFLEHKLEIVNVSICLFQVFSSLPLVGKKVLCAVTCQQDVQAKLFELCLALLICFVKNFFRLFVVMVLLLDRGIVGDERVHDMVDFDHHIVVEVPFC